jgi:hypothetical protein
MMVCARLGRAEGEGHPELEKGSTSGSGSVDGAPNGRAGGG